MRLTGILCTAVMIILGIYDAIIVMNHGVGCSISQWVQETGFASPAFVLMIGFLLGHFFGYMPPKWKNSEKLIKQMADRLVEYDEISYDKEEKVYYWTSCGVILEGQCNRKNLGEKRGKG